MQTIKQIIKEALGIKREIADDDNQSSIPEWDSLGHLNILTALDKAFDGKAASIENLAQATSVKEIVQIFRKEGLIE